MLSVFVSVFPANLSRRVIVRGSRLCFVLFPELNGHLASGVVFGDVKERVAAVDRCDELTITYCVYVVNTKCDLFSYAHKKPAQWRAWVGAEWRVERWMAGPIVTV